MKLAKKLVISSLFPLIGTVTLVFSMENSNPYFKYVGTFSAMSLSAWGMALLMKPDQTEAEFWKEAAQAFHQDYLESQSELERLQHYYSDRINSNTTR